MISLIEWLTSSRRRRHKKDHGAYFELPVYKSTTSDCDPRLRGGGSAVDVLGNVSRKFISSSYPWALYLLGLLGGTDGGSREPIEFVGDFSSTGKIGEPGLLNATSAACLDAWMSGAIELLSPGCTEDKRSPRGIDEKCIRDCAIDDTRSSGWMNDMCPVDISALAGPYMSGETVLFIPSVTKDKGLEFGSSDTVASWLFLLLFCNRFASFPCFNSTASLAVFLVE
jgi:hypothetical protein